jgi:flagellar capping protein FliD
VAKRTRLERQFANMESVLAGLQSQQQALSQMQFISPMSSSTKK